MVSVDRVYQTVQKILNKEQRGYIPPVEFNLFANQAQIEIFENYFYDIDTYMQGIRNDSDFADLIRNLEEKALIFYATTELMEDAGTDDMFTDPTDLYRLGRVYLNNIVADQVDHKTAAYVNLSPLTVPTRKQPIYTRTNSKFVLHFGGGQMLDTDVVRIDYLRRPANAEWAYRIVNGQPIFNSANSTDFELHPSELPLLILKICALAGVAVRSLDVAQFIQGEETGYVAEQKQ